MKEEKIMSRYRKAAGALALMLAGGAVLLSACGDKQDKQDTSKVQEQKEDTKKEVEEEYANADFTVNLDGIKTNTIKTGISVHDPSVIKIGDEYYIYGSHMTAAKSRD